MPQYTLNTLYMVVMETKMKMNVSEPHQLEIPRLLQHWQILCSFAAYKMENLLDLL